MSNPFQRKKAEVQQKFIETKPWQQTKVEFKRAFTTAKLQAYPFFKTLDFSFFVRLTFFAGVCYYCAKQGSSYNQEKVVCKQPDAMSPTRHSKTFEKDQKLDEILS